MALQTVFTVSPKPRLKWDHKEFLEGLLLEADDARVRFLDIVGKRRNKS